MKRRIAVCDDEVLSLKQISDCLDQIGQDIQEDLQVLYYSSGDALLENLPRDLDVLLLDIGMECTNGMDVARQLRRRGVDSIIIFITSMTEYALEAYEVHAFSFLGKPVQCVALRRQLEEAFAQLDKSKGTSMVVNDGTSTDVLQMDDIIYAEVLQHKTKIVMNQGERTYKIPLSFIEGKVKNQHFFRCHKSYLINLKRVVRIDFSTLTMENGDQVPVSKYRRQDFLLAYSRFVGEDL